MPKNKKKYKNYIQYSLIINAITLLAAVFIYRPFFEENDDAFLSMIAEGAYGAREVHLIYANVILGYIYKALYTICPFIRWHSVLQYLFMFIALTAFSYLIQVICAEKEHEKTGRLLPIVFLLAVFHEAYVSVQYSKSATLVSAIAYVLILYGTSGWCTGGSKPEKQEQAGPSGNTAVRVLAYILIVYGMLLRDSSFLLASLVMLPMLIYDFARNMKTAGGSRGKVFMKYFIAFAPVAVCFLIFTLVNKAAYNRDAAWKDFMKYNAVRMDFQDYRYDLLDYNKYASRLKQMDINENDAILYITWQFGDDSVLTREKMEEVLKDAPSRWSPVECVKALIQHVYEDVLIFDPLVIAFIISVIYLIFSLVRKHESGCFLMLILELVEFAGILVYYEYCGRWTHRIVFAAMLVLAVELMCLIAVKGLLDKPAAGENLSMVRAVVTLMAVFCIAALLGNRFDYNSYKRSDTDYHAMLGSLKDNKDTLYIADTFTFQKAYRYDVFRPYEQGSLDNFAAVGSWFVNSPITKRITEKYGYSNPFTALAGKDSVDKSVLLIDNMYFNEKLTYLRDHYGDIDLEKTAEEFGFTIYGKRPR